LQQERALGPVLRELVRAQAPRELGKQLPELEQELA